MDNQYTDATLINTSQYLERMKALKEELSFMLREFKPNFVLSHMYPENEEYQQLFSSVVDRLKQTLSQFFTLSNDVQSNIDSISKTMVELDGLIQKEREKNRELKEKLGVVERENNASVKMIHNYAEIYDMRYLRNWALGIATLACIATIRMTYEPSQ